MVNKVYLSDEELEGFGELLQATTALLGPKIKSQCSDFMRDMKSHGTNELICNQK